MDQDELRPQSEHQQPAKRAAAPPRAIADERDLLQELQIKQFELDTLNDELRRSRSETRRFAEIFNLMTDGVQVCELILDESGHPIDVLIHDVNPAYETQTGMSRESVVGRRVTEILPILEPAWLLRYGDLVHHKKPIAFDEYSGALRRWFRASAKWIHGNRFFVVFHDITKFKQTEAAARQSETIIRSSDDAIMSKSLDGIVTSWNPGAEAMFGYSADEMIGKKMALLFPTERVNEEDVILARIRGGETLVQSDTTRLHKDGNEIEVSVTISPIFDQEKTIVGASNVVRNISARKRAERLTVA